MAPGSAFLWELLGGFAPIPALTAYALALLICLRGHPKTTRRALVQSFARSGLLAGFSLPLIGYSIALVLFMSDLRPAQGLTVAGSAIMIIMLAVTMTALGSVLGALGGAFAGWVTSLIGYAYITPSMA